LSNIGALFFLALWHGLHPGYFVCFSLEFLDMEGEKRWTRRLEKYVKPLYKEENGTSVKIQILKRLHRLFCWIGQTCALYYAMISFELLNIKHVVFAYNSVYWIGHVIVISLILLDVILPRSGSKSKINNNNNNNNNNIISNNLDISNNSSNSNPILINGFSKVNGEIIVNGGLKVKADIKI